MYGFKSWTCPLPPVNPSNSSNPRRSGVSRGTPFQARISHGFHSNGNGYIGVSKIDAKKVNNLMSDRYIGGGWSDENGHFYAPDNKGIIVVDKRFTSLEEAKRIIGVEQPYFLYQLATPIERDLTPDTQ